MYIIYISHSHKAKHTHTNTCSHINTGLATELVVKLVCTVCFVYNRVQVRVQITKTKNSHKQKNYFFYILHIYKYNIVCSSTQTIRPTVYSYSCKHIIIDRDAVCCVLVSASICVHLVLYIYK